MPMVMPATPTPIVKTVRQGHPGDVRARDAAYYAGADDRAGVREPLELLAFVAPRTTPADEHGGNRGEEQDRPCHERALC
jgi:hypothetical protein